MEQFVNAPYVVVEAITLWVTTCLCFVNSDGGKEFVFDLKDKSVLYVQVPLFKRECFFPHRELLWGLQVYWWLHSFSLLMLYGDVCPLSHPSCTLALPTGKVFPVPIE
jgi:hypothetical protein